MGVLCFKSPSLLCLILEVYEVFIEFCTLHYYLSIFSSWLKHSAVSCSAFYHFSLLKCLFLLAEWIFFRAQLFTCLLGFLCCQVEDLEQFSVYVAPSPNITFPVRNANNSLLLWKFCPLKIPSQPVSIARPAAHGESHQVTIPSAGANANFLINYLLLGTESKQTVPWFHMPWNLLFPPPRFSASC